MSCTAKVGWLLQTEACDTAGIYFSILVQLQLIRMTVLFPSAAAEERTIPVQSMNLCRFIPSEKAS